MREATSSSSKTTFLIYKLVKTFDGLPINDEKESGITRKTENLGFVGMYLQSDSACLSFQMNHLVNVHDSVKQHEEITDKKKKYWRQSATLSESTLTQ